MADLRRQRSTPHVAIVGTGIGGLTAAIALRAKGIDVDVYEAAPAPRNTGTALGVASNGTKVLRALGLTLGEDGHGQPCEHFELRTAPGELIREFPIRKITAELGHPVVSIHRNDLTKLLLEAAGDTPIHYGVRITDVANTGSGIRATSADGADVRADVLVGADGISSTVRAALHGGAPPTERGYICWLATVKFSHPRMTRGYAGHYWGRGRRFGLIDIGAGNVYWWGTANMPAAQARNWHGGKAAILAEFDGWAPEVLDAIDQTPEDTIVTVPAQDRPFSRHWGRGAVTLLGDAAHPMLTSMSQGASAGIEDGYVLAEALARVDDPIAALRTYENLRRRRTRNLVRGSRRLANLEQTEHRAMIALRNLGLRWTPTPIIKRQNTRPMQFDLAWNGS